MSIKGLPYFRISEILPGSKGHFAMAILETGMTPLATLLKHRLSLLPQEYGRKVSQLMSDDGKLIVCHTPTDWDPRKEYQPLGPAITVSQENFELVEVSELTVKEKLSILSQRPINEFWFSSGNRGNNNIFTYSTEMFTNSKTLFFRVKKPFFFYASHPMLMLVALFDATRNDSTESWAAVKSKILPKFQRFSLFEGSYLEMALEQQPWIWDESESLLDREQEKRKTVDIKTRLDFLQKRCNIFDIPWGMSSLGGMKLVRKGESSVEVLDSKSLPVMNDLVTWNLKETDTFFFGKELTRSSTFEIEVKEFDLEDSKETKDLINVRKFSPLWINSRFIPSEKTTPITKVNYFFEDFELKSGKVFPGCDYGVYGMVIEMEGAQIHRILTADRRAILYDRDQTGGSDLKAVLSRLRDGDLPYLSGEGHVSWLSYSEYGTGQGDAFWRIGPETEYLQDTALGYSQAQYGIRFLSTVFMFPKTTVISHPPIREKDTLEVLKNHYRKYGLEKITTKDGPALKDRISEHVNEVASQDFEDTLTYKDSGLKKEFQDFFNQRLMVSSSIKTPETNSPLTTPSSRLLIESNKGHPIHQILADSDYVLNTIPSMGLDSRWTVNLKMLGRTRRNYEQAVFIPTASPVIDIQSQTVYSKSSLCAVLPAPEKIDLGSEELEFLSQSGIHLMPQSTQGVDIGNLAGIDSSEDDDDEGSF